MLQGNHDFRTSPIYISARTTSIRDTVGRVRPPSLNAKGHLEFFLARGLCLLLFRERIGRSRSVRCVPARDGAMLSASRCNVYLGSRFVCGFTNGPDLPLEMPVGRLTH